MRENKDKPLTKAQRAILDTAVAIRHETSTIEDAAFLARQFVQATLPHSDPKSDTWRRVNGNFSLGIQAGFDPETGTKYGVPYGVIPRLLLFWITTEAVRTKNPRLVLGSSLSDFMREVGLNPDTGGGKRSDAKRLHEQCLRLFNARISFVGDTVDGERLGKDRRTLEVTDHQVLWWDKKSPGQATLWLSYIDLTPKFFAAITAAPIPVDTRALRVLKQSPLALDLYALSCYEAFRIEQTGHTRVIPWRSLMQQLGADYQAEGAEKEFARKCRSAMRKVAAVMPGLRIAYQKGELCILAGSKTAIPRKKLATA